MERRHSASCTRKPRWRRSSIFRRRRDFQKGAIFPWTISDYPLKQAILDGIVKRPVKGIAKIPEAKSDYASVRYRGYLTAAVERWKEYREQLKPLKQKPVLFIMMNSTEEADDVADWLAKAIPLSSATEERRSSTRQSRAKSARKILDEAAKAVQERGLATTARSMPLSAS